MVQKLTGPQSVLTTRRIGLVFGCKWREVRERSMARTTDANMATICGYPCKSFAIDKQGYGSITGENLLALVQ